MRLRLHIFSFLLYVAVPTLYCFTALFLVLCSSKAYGAYGSYSGNVSFGTTKITYDELTELINKTHNFFERANANIDEPISDERVRIGDGKRTIEVREKINLNMVKELPKLAYIASYSINSSNANAPITSVKFDFNDNYRTLTIEGNNSEQVEALFSFLKDEVDKYSYFLGGNILRTFGGLAFFVLLWLIPLVLFLSTTRISSKAVAIVIISCLTISITLVILPFNKWLPGFVVYDPNSSFLIRNSALFTFISFIAIPLILIGKGFIWILHKRTEEERRTKSMETRIGEAIQKVDEIKKSPTISYGDLSKVEEDIVKLRDEFFENRDVKKLSKKEVDIDLEKREMRLNSEWRPVYLFLINTLITLLESYNENLIDDEKFVYNIPRMPSNVFSIETDAYKGSIKFSNGMNIKIRFYIRRPIEKEQLPKVVFNIDSESDTRKSAQINVDIKPDKKIIRFYKDYDDINMEIDGTDHELKDDNYKLLILNFLKTVIEHHLLI